MESWHRRVAQIIETEAGLDLSRCRSANVPHVLASVAVDLGLSGPEAVLEATLGARRPLVVERLLSGLLVHETFFYRYGAQLDVMARGLVSVLRESPPVTLRLWSAGCSSGPEAYTLAMIAILAREQARCRADVQVLGTDLSSSAVAVAQKAVYPSSTVVDLPREMRDRFLEDAGSGRHRVREEVMRVVRFRVHNLRSHPVPGSFHVISCRNVLMYLREEAVRVAVGHLAGALDPRGVLAVGHGESLRSHRDLVVPDRDSSVNLYRPVKKVAGLDANGFREGHEAGGTRRESTRSSR
jgi:chemotaxis methyl-accepting protein methylase